MELFRNRADLGNRQYRTARSRLAGRSRLPRSPLGVDDVLTAWDFVACGLGVTILPGSLAAASRPDLRAIPLADRRRHLPPQEACDVVRHLNPVSDVRARGDRAQGRDPAVESVHQPGDSHTGVPGWRAAAGEADALPDGGLHPAGPGLRRTPGLLPAHRRPRRRATR